MVNHPNRNRRARLAQQDAERLAKSVAVLCEVVAALADPEHIAHEAVKSASRDWLEREYLAYGRRALAECGFDRYGDRVKDHGQPVLREKEPASCINPNCNGTGLDWGETCAVCGGTGVRDGDELTTGTS